MHVQLRTTPTRVTYVQKLEISNVQVAPPTLEWNILHKKCILYSGKYGMLFFRKEERYVNEILEFLSHSSVSGECSVRAST